MAAHSEEQPREEPDQQAGQEAEHPIDGRLRVYLGRLVDAQGRMKAADALGVNYKTLARGLDEQGPLTVWLRAALLVKALEDGVTALAGEGQASGDAGAEVPSGGIAELAGEVAGRHGGPAGAHERRRTTPGGARGTAGGVGKNGWPRWKNGWPRWTSGSRWSRCSRDRGRQRRRRRSSARPASPSGSRPHPPAGNRRPPRS